MLGMTMGKIAVSLPRPTLVRARRAVREGKATSMSAYVAKAIDQKSMLDDLDELLTEMLAESGGPLSSSEKRAARDALFGSAARRRKRA